MPLSPGALLHNNRYRIEFLLGAGGMGAVYRAWDTALDRPCALKENTGGDPAQFEREARILARLKHPALPTVYDHFVIPGQGQYLVMEFVEGEDLQTLLQRRAGPAPETEALRWIEQVLGALEYLHAQTPPVIHRDTKPANIKITPRGEAVLVDFGIAKAYDPSAPTTVGARAATPGYAAPEQYGHSGRTDPRTDVYAVGATLYALLTGQMPTDSLERVVGARLLAPHDLNPGISPAVATAILKAMELNAGQRYQTAAELRAALKSLPAPRPAQTVVLPRAEVGPVRTAAIVGGLILGGLAVVALVGGLAFFALILGRQTGTPTPPPNPTGLPTQTPTLTQTLALTPTPLPPTDTPVPITPTPGTGSIQISDADGMALLFVPAGEFLMGSDSGGADERPVHTVYLDALWIDRTEITNRMYALCVNARACEPPADRSSHTRSSYYGDSQFDDYPVIFVSGDDAAAYCAWAGRRLPTEAEWEKAARGTTGWIWPWGDASPYTAPANYYAESSDETARVGSYPRGASPYGALDMAGNVWEWVADWYDENYYSRSPAANPTGPSSGQYRGLRGGSWGSAIFLTRAADRGWAAPYETYYYVGFRCARTR